MLLIFNSDFKLACFSRGWTILNLEYTSQRKSRKLQNKCTASVQVDNLQLVFFQNSFNTFRRFIFIQYISTFYFHSIHFDVLPSLNFFYNFIYLFICFTFTFPYSNFNRLDINFEWKIIYQVRISLKLSQIITLLEF